MEKKEKSTGEPDQTIQTDATATNPQEVAPETNVVDELTKKYDELNDKHLRLAAEFENHKKRTARELETRVRFANEKFARDVVEIFDNFERALKSDDANLRDGLEQIQKLYLSTLEKNGIKPMNAKGTQFDPSLHEAVVMIPSDKPAGEIIDVAVPGYTMLDKVLRHAKVVVSAEKPEEDKS